MHKHWQKVVLTCSLIMLGGCQQATLQKILDPATYSRSGGKPSAAPIEATIDDISFAQAGLRKLGYGIGRVDGIWGARSAQAMRRFEKDNGLKSAEGQLTELNLWTLELRTGSQRTANSAQLLLSSRSLAAQLHGKQLDESEPPLIITERDYQIMARANPYSEVLTTLPAGTGLYILRLQHGWYEVESTDDLHGYIKAN